ncbi:hypothetical protein PTTG_25732 [Puccinia triticina 1-1 BBBD Race 1]|uniref:Uncharacterized protein n=1 Tax=Puccinia triticina (isolate 1-1 / race 1 (BBBD)) TaxID=630390 RepID=A0A180GZX4_PUCT1|nr:hypothetical protein PTTG_25732 [Puccinia triticina 1-1 BBBD Race 1]WAR57367.1 hypothetical protein PtB15_8B414 [Puccinia triticina]
MKSGYHPCLLGAHLILSSYLKSSISTPPTPIHVEPETLRLGSLGDEHVPGVSCGQLETVGCSDFKHYGQMKELTSVTSDSDDLFNTMNAGWYFDSELEDREWWMQVLGDYSGSVPKHNIVSPVGGAQVEQEGKS